MRCLPLLLLAACGGGTLPDSSVDPSNPSLAEVVGVDVSGAEGEYSFAVTVRSPDEGCERYANWWEVVSADGELIYRRILGHSHVGEQPFTRGGGPVDVAADTAVIVRAHMHPDGYGAKAWGGSVGDGIKEITVDIDFSEELARAEPLPDGCAF